ncbi:DUF1836 domain-containing protein [Bacillus hwajinpoensis]|uniref:DUF1836 domain-containing protein n=1 Tax=Guptibacillus hwajinpoensis TaxID=208199 RepID=A0A845F439_9BACL|nr:DUF1836 domain-containing protein [Pseudalkalibacillus hwajinpoensis]MYL65569.1 DUF1836 domain-containing protein [Pseudalkalibacillus hwajinpoensis]
MRGFYLTRTEMGTILKTIRRQEIPDKILMKAMKRSGSEKEELPTIFAKLSKATEGSFGFSINEIATLGNQLEYASFRSTAVQNWVKRDIKEWIGAPQLGKKYAIEQAAILFIVEDLKNTHDFESIRLLLKFAFNNPADRNDDLIDPLAFYTAYSQLFEAIHTKVKPTKEGIRKKAMELSSIFSDLTEKQKEDIEKLLISAALSVQASFYQSLSKQYLEDVWR